MKPPVPARLYKYRSLAVREYAAQTLRHRTLYAASPADLNDPFECRYSVKPLPRKEQIEAIARSRSLKRIVDPRKRIRAAIDDADSTVRQEVIAALPTWHRGELDLQAGIISLSARKDDLLMWGHYADSHRGICLEFDGSALPFSDAKRVRYSKVFPAISLPPTDFAETGRLVLLSKSEHWRYEEEWRAVQLNFDKYPRLVAFAPEALTGVIFGCMCSDANREIVRRWVTAAGCAPAFYDAVRSESDYSLAIVRRACSA
jgi:hypothetical protein